MSIRYVSVFTKDGENFILRVTSDGEKFIRGFEVNRDGDEVHGKDFDRRLRVVAKDAILKTVSMKMNPTYAKLERA